MSNKYKMNIILFLLENRKIPVALLRLVNVFLTVMMMSNESHSDIANMKSAQVLKQIYLSMSSFPGVAEYLQLTNFSSQA
jgi:hypothetical protein